VTRLLEEISVTEPVHRSPLSQCRSRWAASANLDGDDPFVPLRHGARGHPILVSGVTGLARVAAYGQHLPVAEFLIDPPLAKDGGTRLRPIVRAQRGSLLEEADGEQIMEALVDIGWAGSSDVTIDLGELSGVEPGGERALATVAERVRSDAYRVLVVLYPREGPVADALEASGILADQRIRFHPADVA